MFSPYHRFANCNRLERWIQTNLDNGSVHVDVINGFNRYHFALIHKLKSARYHYENLEEVMNNLDPTIILSNSGAFLQQINMHLDGFFYCGGSALDILARELLVYFNIPLPARVYYQTARDELTRLRPGDAIIPRLDDPQWRDEFSNYRNALTHELLIAGNYNINVNVHGINQQMRVIFSMPDDPRAEIDTRTFRRHPDGLEYCRSTFTRLLSHINQIYGEVDQRIRVHNRLPI